MTALRESPDPCNELSISFGYQCSANQRFFIAPHETEYSSGTQIQNSFTKMRPNISFSCLSGAAINANATLANTKICNGIIGDEILPILDSPNNFRKIESSTSLSKLDSILSTSHGSMSSLSGSNSTDYDYLENSRNLYKSTGDPIRTESSSFLNAMDVQMAGGAAGEDRVQAVCSEESGWLFCGIYDGFNGRDAADFLAGFLYEKIGFNLHSLECLMREKAESNEATNLCDQCYSTEEIFSSESFHMGVLDCLGCALSDLENDFMRRVEQEMDERPDLVSIGSSVLAVLLHSNNLYVLNLGDSRAVIAEYDPSRDGNLTAVQLTESHTVDNISEYQKLISDHPNENDIIIRGRVKGKLQLTRAFGVGYLKERKMNDALMGILRVHDLQSPPYIYSDPFIKRHRVSENNLFVVLGSDGLFDFFNNIEVVELVHQFIQSDPFGDPAKYLIEKLLYRAAENAGFSPDELMSIPVGRRRKYHDDVTIIVIILGTKQRTTSASTTL